MTEELQNTSLSNQGEKQIIADTTSLPPIPGKYRVMRRNGKVTSFDLDKIISIIVTLKKTAIELPKARPPCPKPILKAKK